MDCLVNCSIFLGGTCNANVTTKWRCHSVISDSYVRQVGSRSSSCISKESSSITLQGGTGKLPRLNSSCPTLAFYHTGTLHYHDCSFCFGKHLESKGYYLVSVPFSLLRHLRSTGCFKVQVMHFQMEFFDLFDVPLNAVLDAFEKRNSRRIIPNFRMCRQYPWAALFRICRQFSSEYFHVAQL